MTAWYQFKTLEDSATRLGFKCQSGSHGYEVDLISNTTWVCYSPEMSMFSGSITEAICWLSGVERGMNYAKHLGWKREPSEKKYLDQEAKRKYNEEKKKTFEVLKA